jgi:hypothetical protein
MKESSYSKLRAALTNHIHADHADEYPGSRDFTLISTEGVLNFHRHHFPGCRWNGAPYVDLADPRWNGYFNELRSMGWTAVQIAEAADERHLASRQEDFTNYLWNNHLNLEGTDPAPADWERYLGTAESQYQQGFTSTPDKADIPTGYHRYYVVYRQGRAEVARTSTDPADGTTSVIMSGPSLTDHKAHAIALILNSEEET